MNYRVAVVREGKRVVFLHAIEPGRADRSYGIEVARLAGLPEEVLNRAEVLLRQLEGKASSQREVAVAREPMRQLSLFDDGLPVLQKLKSLDLDRLRPIDALNVLYELQEMAKGTAGGSR